MPLAEILSSRCVELGLVAVGRPPGRAAGAARRRAARGRCATTSPHGPSTTSPPPPRAAGRPPPRRRRRRLAGNGILGIHGRLWASPMLRAVRAAVAMRDEQQEDPLLLAVAQVLEHLDADDDGADGPRRDPEEEPGERVLGDEDQEDGQLDGRSPAIGMSSSTADEAGHDRQQERAARRTGRARACPRARGRSTRRWRA